jgi:bile acid:Na+ symporter, BASS family
VKFLIGAPRALTPLALLAAGLALAIPSGPIARRADLLLAALVLVTALGITAGELRDDLHRHRTSIVTLSVAPMIVLSAAAWAIGHAFDEPVRDGLLAIGASCAEVATVGLVTLAGADATVALGAVAGSLVISALLGPVVIGILAGHTVHGGTGHLLGRFALAASFAFLAVSAVAAEPWRRTTPRPVAVPGALSITMRDFAVAAALASQAFGPGAAAVAGVYGVVMLLAGSAAAGLVARAHRGVSSRA